MSLVPGDCLYEDFLKYHPLNKNFNPADLDAEGNEKEVAVKTINSFFQKMGQICDCNLLRSVDYLVKKSANLNYSELKWIGKNQKRFDDSSFQLDYSN